MDTMIEKMAKAFAFGYWEAIHSKGETEDEDSYWASIRSESIRDAYRSAASKTLEKLLIPTEGMDAAGAAMWEENDDARYVYRAMIHAAINGK